MSFLRCAFATMAIQQTPATQELSSPATTDRLSTHSGRYPPTGCTVTSQEGPAPVCTSSVMPSYMVPPRELRKDVTLSVFVPFSSRSLLVTLMRYPDASTSDILLWLTRMSHVKSTVAKPQKFLPGTSSSPPSSGNWSASCRGSPPRAASMKMGRRPMTSKFPWMVLRGPIIHMSVTLMAAIEPARRFGSRRRSCPSAPSLPWMGWM
mmetsp:Transcript_10382/g.26932  ORF Transcript_10382/g.26932 Transcript_10382/m.26932 type:complete len:207 (-) Transcript_10382:1240-1860(-)